MATKQILDFESTSPRPCLACKGTGVSISPEFTGIGGEVYPRIERTCRSCKGEKTMPSPDYDGILRGLMTREGKFRRSSPIKNPWSVNRHQARLYFIWRLARFHGGRDVCMPMTADSVTSGDPFKPELDAMADMVAKKVFGTNMAAAYRWGNLLFGEVDVPKDQPDSARSGGPVADENKPDFEMIERK